MLGNQDNSGSDMPLNVKSSDSMSANPSPPPPTTDIPKSSSLDSSQGWHTPTSISPLLPPASLESDPPGPSMNITQPRLGFLHGPRREKSRPSSPSYKPPFDETSWRCQFEVFENIKARRLNSSHGKDEDQVGEDEGKKGIDGVHDAEADENDDGDGDNRSVGDENDEKCSEASWPSTQAHNQEPFDSFVLKVHQLCALIFPPRMSFLQKLTQTRMGQYLTRFEIFKYFLPPPPQMIPERLQGGSSNRITNLKMSNYCGQLQGPMSSRDLILRVPRNDWATPSCEVATLEFVRHYTKLPIAEVVAKDFTSHNPLERPYVVYSRIPGEDLEGKWDYLRHEQRCMIARDLAEIYNQMTITKTHGLRYGTIEKFTLSVNPYDSPKTEFGSIQLFDSTIELEHESEKTKLVGEGEYHLIDASEHCYIFLRNMLIRRRTVDIENNRPSSLDIKMWDELRRLLKDMRDKRLFVGSEKWLAHLDLQSRNIMVDTFDDRSARISGVLDWDSAVLAPPFLACTPPWWMWAGGDESDDRFDERDETRANHPPSTPEKAVIKRIFEETVNYRFLHYAYKPQYQLARLIFRLAQDGIESNDKMIDWGRAMKMWFEMRDLEDFGNYAVSPK